MKKRIEQVRVSRIDRIVGNDNALLCEELYDENNNLLESRVYEYGNNGLRSIKFYNSEGEKFAVNVYDEDKTTYVSYENGKKILEVVYDKEGHELSREETEVGTR